MGILNNHDIWGLMGVEILGHLSIHYIHTVVSNREGNTYIRGFSGTSLGTKLEVDTPQKAAVTTTESHLTITSTKEGKPTAAGAPEAGTSVAIETTSGTPEAITTATMKPLIRNEGNLPARTWLIPTSTCETHPITEHGCYPGA